MNPSQLIGIIPAAGAGMRLGLPYPKELYPVVRDNHYKPLAQHVLENMVAVGIEHIVFIVNETKHQLMAFFGSGERFGCRITYAYQEPMRRERKGSSGLAEAIESAYHLYRDRIVMFGMPDTIMTPIDLLGNLMPSGDSLECDVHLGLFHTDRPEDAGIVEHDGQGNVLAIYDKQPDRGLRETWGCCSWSPRFSEYLHRRMQELEEPDFATILNEAAAEGLTLRATRLPDASYTDLGTYEAIERLESSRS